MSTSLSRRGVAIVVALLATGLAIRLAFAFATYGVKYDIDSLRIVADALRAPGFGPYDTGRWPYPGGFLPLLALCGTIARHLDWPFHGVVQIPAILADLGIALLVVRALLRRGCTEARALAGCALVALGPSFIAISGYHGQIDSVATLPALAGALVWNDGRGQRALWAGLLIGAGASVKTPLGFTALALLPSARGWRERTVLIALTVLVPLLTVAPFLAGDAHQVVAQISANAGVPGFGGLSALAQTSLARGWATLENIPSPNGTVLWLTHAQHWLVLAGIAATLVVCWSRRVPPLETAALMWLAVFVFNPNFAYQYMVWGIPFFLAAGYVERTALLQALLLPATLWLYWRPGLDPGGWPYFFAIELAWVAMAVTWVVSTLHARTRAYSSSVPA